MQIVLAIHSLLRWAVLIFGVWSVINALTGLLTNRSFTKNDNRSGLFFMISCDVQLLIGFVTYFANGWFNRLTHLADNIKNPYTRFFTMEHISLMLIAWVLVHIGRTTVKNTTEDSKKHKKMLLFFGIALLLIVAAIPWPFRAALGKAWFPTF
jgi:uncharacterized membrane protein